MHVRNLLETAEDYTETDADDTSTSASADPKYLSSQALCTYLFTVY